MKKVLKATGRILLVIVVIVVLSGVVLFANNKIQLKNEESLLTPLGELVEVDGHNISMYNEGDGEKLLYFYKAAVCRHPYWRQNLFFPCSVMSTGLLFWKDPVMVSVMRLME